MLYNIVVSIKYLAKQIGRCI